MKLYQLFLIIGLSWQMAFCQNESKMIDLNYVPEVTEADKKYADAYHLLDGKWKGTFEIYKDSKRKKKSRVELKDITKESLQKKGIALMSSIEVMQVYTSETPYFQRVTITDYYPESGKTVTAKGVNKVQDGQLFCVVIKPDDTVIHDGYLEKENTIIWQRGEQNPQRIEYFRETVDAQFYEIVGWGYYEGDDTSLSPPLWFYGKYERQD
ncbi:MAG: hypothetical protein AAF960_16015 [Bacteroidota bacterium]